MKRRTYLNLLALTALSLAGCTQQLARDAVFNATSPNGLVVMGIRDGWHLPWNMTVYFMPYDDARKVATGGSFPNPLLSKETIPGNPFMIGQLPPGRYVIGMVSSRLWTDNMEKGTAAFDIRAGEATYIGDFEAAPGLLRARGYDLPAARRALAAYPHVTVPLQVTKPTMVRNICITGNFGGC